jgi:hypothetical protein
MDGCKPINTLKFIRLRRIYFGWFNLRKVVIRLRRIKQAQVSLFACGEFESHWLHLHP